MALPAYKLYGSDGSPYSCKVRAALRFLRIAYEWIPVFQEAAHSGELFSKHFPDIKTKVIPVLVRPDGTYANDSTPLLLELQAQHGKTWRSLFPTSAGARFLCALVEDFADEWLTKVMFEGRFHTLEDAKFGAAWQVLQNPLQSKNTDKALQAIDMFAARQRERRALVGCSDWTCMEKTLRGVCSALETNLRRGVPFIFGSRPTAADFAIYGQLRQLATDPLPSRIVMEYPSVWAWVFRVEDLSGYPDETEPSPDTPTVHPGMLDCLKLCGLCYIPLLLDNERAINEGRREIRVHIFEGAHLHCQPTFKYQLKCLQALRKQYDELPEAEKAQVDATLLNAGIRPETFQQGPPKSKL
ncbi:unnamed protein product [Symbiodinium sp. CCMP2592]|nr:unnamed protein product [Symbiodinium sp. CCMP2592]